MRSQSHWDYGFPVSKVRSRLSMTSWMLLSCLYLFVVRMLRSRRDSFTLALINSHVCAGCEPEVNRRLGRAWGVMDSLDHGLWCCRFLCGRTKVRDFRSLVLPVLLYGCETWTLTRDPRWRQFLWCRVSSEISLLSLVGRFFQQAVSERDSNEICYLHSL